VVNLFKYFTLTCCCYLQSDRLRFRDLEDELFWLYRTVKRTVAYVSYVKRWEDSSFTKPIGILSFGTLYAIYSRLMLYIPDFLLKIIEVVTYTVNMSVSSFQLGFWLSRCFTWDFFSCMWAGKYLEWTVSHFLPHFFQFISVILSSSSPSNLHEGNKVSLHQTAPAFT
jgi:hypothetical protein